LVDGLVVVGHLVVFFLLIDALNGSVIHTPVFLSSLVDNDSDSVGVLLLVTPVFLMLLCCFVVNGVMGHSCCS
jgi:hypothetical protein